jgi:hypothetical protein
MQAAIVNQISLFAMVMNHYATRIPKQRAERRIRGLQRPMPQQVAATLWTILNRDTGEWRVEDAGARIDGSEDYWIVQIDPNTRSFETEKRCQDISALAIAKKTLAPVIRHVRTGEDDGTETVTIGGKTFDRPRAITECGAAATGGDYNKIAARVDLRDGSAAEMCPACRAKLEARGHRDLSKLPGRRGSATDKQRDFLRRLLDEGARNGRPYLMDARDVDKLSSREASAKIDELKALKARGWKGDL